MPLYEFYCDRCGKLHEELEKEETETIECFCGGTAHRAISKANWSIKGTCYNPVSPYEKAQEPEANEANGRLVMYDIYCPECGTTKEDVLVKNDEDPADACEKCGAQMKKVCACGSFELKYDPKKDTTDWSGNTTRYWDDVRKARQEGKDVKPAGED